MRWPWLFKCPHSQGTLLTLVCLYMPLITMAEKQDEEFITPTPTQDGQVADVNDASHDAVFGEITGEGPNYRSVGIRVPWR